MFPTQTATIQVRRELQETWYILPRRSLGALRFLGLLPFLFGVFFLVFGAFWVANSIRSFSPGGSAFVRAFSAIHLLFGVPLFLAGVGGFLLGAGTVLNRWVAQVGLDRETLRYRERWGLLRWTWSRDLADIGELIIADPGVTTTLHAHAMSSPSAARPAAATGCLIIKGPSITPLLLAVGYPPGLLRDLARMLARDAAMFSPHLAQGGRSAFTVTDASGAELAARMAPTADAPSAGPPPVP